MSDLYAGSSKGGITATCNLETQTHDKYKYKHDATRTLIISITAGFSTEILSFQSILKIGVENLDDGLYESVTGKHCIFGRHR